MANHRPKSLSELNNVYDKAMRAERAIKEGSDMLSIPEPETAPESENIFQQLEHKAAQAHKNQVFDPDITNIANDFLKRYAQPEKPKETPREIKRPAPSIQVYHTPVKESEKKPEDISLNTGNDFASSLAAASVPVHKPSHTAPSTDSVKPQAAPPIQQEPAEIRTPAPQVQKVTATPAPEVKQTPEVKQAVKAQGETKFDHTPRPAPSRVRITSTERSELMEEYMRVMSDDDDEPSAKKSVFSFFKKKKKYDEDDANTAESLYDSYSDDADEDSAEEIPVVPFDASDVKYEDEYSDSPEEEKEDVQLSQEPMNLYDYIEADLDFDDADDMYEEDDEDSTLDVSFMSGTVIKEEISDKAAIEYFVQEESEEAIEETEAVEITEEAEEIISEPEEAETVEAENTAEETVETVLYPTEEAAETEEAEEVVYPDAPPAGMVFEDVFSVTDESKRSLTGGNWTEVFGEELPVPVSDEAEEIISEPEEAEAETAEAEDTSEETVEAVVYPTEEASETEEAEAVVYAAEAEEIISSPEETAEAHEEIQESAVETAEEYEGDFDDYDAPKKRTGLKIVMAIAIVICFITAVATALLSAVIGVDTGKEFSDNLRAFSVPETVESIGLNKGDLVIAENVYAHSDSLYVFVNQATHDYDFGKVIETTTNLSGDYLYISQTKDGTQLINRDTAMGVIVATYGGIGSVLSAICEYSILIIIALAILIIALIVCLVIITRKRRLYEEASAIYDHMESYDDDDPSDDNEPGDENNDDEYYSDYDTDGIEQGLFANI